MPDENNPDENMAMKTISGSTRRLLGAGIKQANCHEQVGQLALQVLQSELLSLKGRQQELLRRRSQLLSVATDDKASVGQKAGGKSVSELSSLEFRAGCYMAARGMARQFAELRLNEVAITDQRRLVSAELAKISRKISLLQQRLRQDSRIRRAAIENREASDTEEVAAWGLR